MVWGETWIALGAPLDVGNECGTFNLDKMPQTGARVGKRRSRWAAARGTPYLPDWSAFCVRRAASQQSSMDWLQRLG